jgi:enoyl-CoA hydratase/carnithine racemase
MFVLLREQLELWERDPAIKAVIIRSNCEKAFCAGGDIRAIYENKALGADELIKYFQLEYDTNRYIHHYPKPYIAMVHGITMGGGVGVSLNGKYTLTADHLRWAMPETLIGFFPDIGASYYLSRLDSIGNYLALTGSSINAADALNLNLVKRIILFDQFDAIEKNFLENDVESVLNTLVDVDVSISLNRIDIHQHFCFPTMEEIFISLEKSNNDWARDTLQLLSQRSPISLKVTLEQLHRAKNKSFDEVIEMDLKIAHQMLKHPDFYEGIRAAVIDKDKNPHWSPAALSQIRNGDVNAYF